MVNGGGSPPAAFLLALELDHLGHLLLEGGDGAFEGAEAAFHALFPGFFPALVFSEHALEFEHALP